MVEELAVLRVGIDARFIDHPGIGRYIKNLLRTLSPSIDIVAVVNSDHCDVVSTVRPDSTVIEIGDKPFTPTEQVVLPYRLRQADIDVFHSTQFNVPLLWQGRLVVTIHDCAYDRYPQEFGGQTRLAKYYYSFMMSQAGKQADQVIAVSAMTRADLNQFYGLPSDAITVVPHGVTQHPVPETAPDCVPADEFFIHVGTARPRKNIDGLLRAYAVAVEKENDLPQLVLAGSHDDRFLDIEGLADELGIKERVHEVGYLSDDALWWYYTNAVALVFPSLYEGFGFPVLEAMSVGTPVITANEPPLSDIAGNAAILVDPNKPADIATALVNIAANDERQAELGRLGSQRAQEFTWEKTSRATADVYRSVITP